jgi:hypothetical protein
MSKWHHITGILFGLLVLTWAVSGVLEVLGPDNLATAEQVARARSAPPAWSALKISELQAARQLKNAGLLLGDPIAVELTSLKGNFGYQFQFANGSSAWVDAASGVVRGALDSIAAARAAQAALGMDAPVREATLISQYDAYYYARPGRELELPVWRVSLGDPDASALVGYVFTTSRVYRWLRDGLHTFDFPAINNKRPLWDLVLLPLMIGGSIAAFTGVWLAIRRLQRTA